MESEGATWQKKAHVTDPTYDSAKGPQEPQAWKHQARREKVRVGAGGVSLNHPSCKRYQTNVEQKHRKRLRPSVSKTLTKNSQSLKTPGKE